MPSATMLLFILHLYWLTSTVHTLEKTVAIAERSRSEAGRDLGIAGYLRSRLLNLDVRLSAEMFREPEC